MGNMNGLSPDTLRKLIQRAGLWADEPTNGEVQIVERKNVDEVLVLASRRHSVLLGNEIFVQCRAADREASDHLSVVGQVQRSGREVVVHDSIIATYPVILSQRGYLGG